MISILIELALIVFTCLVTNFIAYKTIRKWTKKNALSYMKWKQNTTMN